MQRAKEAEEEGRRLLQYALDVAGREGGQAGRKKEKKVRTGGGRGGVREGERGEEESGGAGGAVTLWGGARHEAGGKDPHPAVLLERWLKGGGLGGEVGGEVEEEEGALLLHAHHPLVRMLTYADVI